VRKKASFVPIKVSDRDTSYFMADLNAWMMRHALKGEGKD
jgi:hypothetical protein